MLYHTCFISKRITICSCLLKFTVFVRREESSRRRKKERGRALRRYLLIGLATVGGGTVLGVFKQLLIRLNESNTAQCTLL